MTTHPLSIAQPGKRYVIQTIYARNNAARRLAQLGLLRNTPIYVIKNLGKGPILIEVRNTRVVIGRGLANKVLVSPG